MNAQLEIADFSQIASTLQSFSEPMHVDNVDFRFDAETRSAVATFACEHYGEVVVTRVMEEGDSEISVNDLRVMANIANDELERIISDSGFGAVFNVERDTPTAEVPEGFTMKFVPTLN